MNEKEDIYEMKMINVFYEKSVISVARQNETPHWNQPTRAVIFWAVHEGLVGGASE